MAAAATQLGTVAAPSTSAAVDTCSDMPMAAGTRRPRRRSTARARGEEGAHLRSSAAWSERGKLAIGAPYARTARAPNASASVSRTGRTTTPTGLEGKRAEPFAERDPAPTACQPSARSSRARRRRGYGVDLEHRAAPRAAGVLDDGRGDAGLARVDVESTVIADVEGARRTSTSGCKPWRAPRRRVRDEAVILTRAATAAPGSAGYVHGGERYLARPQSSDPGARAGATDHGEPSRSGREARRHRPPTRRERDTSPHPPTPLPPSPRRPAGAGGAGPVVPGRPRVPRGAAPRGAAPVVLDPVGEPPSGRSAVGDVIEMSAQW